MENTSFHTEQPAAVPPKKHIGRDIAVIAGIVISLLAAAFAVTVLVLPRIAGEENAVSRFFLQKYDDNTPAQVIKEFETAFNNNDRDGMAKCYAPGKRLAGNLQAGGLSAANGFLSLFGTDKQVKIVSELTELTADGDTAKGKVIFTGELPFLGKKSVTATVSFLKEEYRWYIDGFSDFSSDIFSP